MRDALILILAAMAVVSTDGCDAKRAIGPRSTSKRAIEVHAADSAKSGSNVPGSTSGSALPSADRTTAAPEKGESSTPYINGGANSSARSFDSATVREVRAVDPLIELSSATVVQKTDNSYTITVQYKFIEGAPNPDKDYMVQINYRGARRPDTHFMPGSALQSEGVITFPSVPDVDLQSRIPLSTFELAIGESRKGFPTAPSAYRTKSNIIEGRIEFADGQ
jgi:hypothetical protein